MVQTKAGTGVKDKALYKRLRKLGVSVKESARVANRSAKTSTRSSARKTSQRSGAAHSLADLKVPELRRRAKKAGIKGRSTMNKKQLVRALHGS
jgi:Rho termination factor, N-terminal domain